MIMINGMKKKYSVYSVEREARSRACNVWKTAKVIARSDNLQVYSLM
jgi:hypothetical protein